MGEQYASNYEKWREFTENIEAVASESSQYVNDYEKSMEVVKDENGQEIEISFAPASYYTDNGNYVNIGDWVWKRNDGKDKFSFDSEAEREWAEMLKDLTKDDLLVGDGRVGKRVTVGKKELKAGVVNLFDEEERNFQLNETSISVEEVMRANSPIKFNIILAHYILPILIL